MRPLYALSTFVALVALATTAAAKPWTGSTLLDDFPFSSTSSIPSIGNAAVEHDGKLYVFVNDGSDIVYRSTTGGAFEPFFWMKLGLKSSHAPQAVVYKGSLYVFAVRAADQQVVFNRLGGGSWSGWMTGAGTSRSGVAAVVHGGLLYLFTTQFGTSLALAGRLIYGRTYNGATWSTFASPVSGSLTLGTPSAISFNNQLYLFKSDSFGDLHYARGTNLSGLGSFAAVGFELGDYDAAFEPAPADPPALVVSNSRLFVFVRDADTGRVYYRLLDLTHGRDAWLPVDAWMPLNRDKAESAVAAATFNGQLKLFYRAKHTVLSFGYISDSMWGIKQVTGQWSTLPLVVLQASDSPKVNIVTGVVSCANTADLTGFDTYLRFANSVYAPALISFQWTQTKSVCNSAINKDASDWPAVEAEASKYYPGNVVVVVRKSSGGGASGASAKAVLVPEFNASPKVCLTAPFGGHLFYNNDLAHELGHYFSLAHTHFDNGKPADVAALQDILDSAGNVEDAFDRDLDENGINDTPPDPFSENFAVKCPADPYEPVVLTDPSTNAPVELVPPRTNVISYYEVNGTVINKLSPDQIRVVYASLTARGFN